jgi:hypothetical protein
LDEKIQSKIQNPKFWEMVGSNTTSPRQKISNPKFKIQNPKSKIQNPKSKILHVAGSSDGRAPKTSLFTPCLKEPKNEGYRILSRMSQVQILPCHLPFLPARAGK